MGEALRLIKPGNPLSQTDTGGGRSGVGVILSESLMHPELYIRKQGEIILLKKSLKHKNVGWGGRIWVISEGIKQASSISRPQVTWDRQIIREENRLVVRK